MHARNSAAMLHSLQFVYYNYILKKEKEREKKTTEIRVLYTISTGVVKSAKLQHILGKLMRAIAIYTHRIPEIANVCEVTVAHGSGGWLKGQGNK